MRIVVSLYADKFRSNVISLYVTYKQFWNDTAAKNF